MRRGKDLCVHDIGFGLDGHIPWMPSDIWHCLLHESYGAVILYTVELASRGALLLSAARFVWPRHILALQGKALFHCVLYSGCKCAYMVS